MVMFGLVEFWLFDLICWVFIGFVDSMVWLMFVVFMFVFGYVKIGFGCWIVLFFV